VPASEKTPKAVGRFLLGVDGNCFTTATTEIKSLDDSDSVYAVREINGIAEPSYQLEFVCRASSNPCPRRRGVKVLGIFQRPIFARYGKPEQRIADFMVAVVRQVTADCREVVIARHANGTDWYFLSRTNIGVLCRRAIQLDARLWLSQHKLKTTVNEETSQRDDDPKW
jgi:hypothetical protein